MSTDTMQRRLDNVIGSIESRTWLVGQYISESAKDPQPITRSILPFRVYRSRQGELVLDGYETYRHSVRTFRLDRFTRLAKGEHNEGDDPAVLNTKNGQVTVYPADWKLVQARPQKVSEAALDKFLANGWATAPYAGVLEPPHQQ